MGCAGYSIRRWGRVKCILIRKIREITRRCKVGNTLCGNLVDSLSNSTILEERLRNIGYIIYYYIVVSLFEFAYPLCKIS